jgi:hypothetical protein
VTDTPRTIAVRIKMHGTEQWGCLDTWGNNSVDIVAETWNNVNDQYSFVGGHRVRLFRVRKNVHFKIPPGATTFDITDVVPAPAAPTKRHDKRRKG